jgi:hypothetical protein
MWTGGDADVEEEDVKCSSASHRCGVIGDQTLWVGVLFLVDVNIGLHVYYIGADGKTHYPLIEGIVLIRAERWIWSLMIQAH